MRDLHIYRKQTVKNGHMAIYPTIYIACSAERGHSSLSGVFQPWSEFRPLSALFKLLGLEERKKTYTIVCFLSWKLCSSRCSLALEIWMKPQYCKPSSDSCSRLWQQLFYSETGPRDINDKSVFTAGWRHRALFCRFHFFLGLIQGKSMYFISWWNWWMRPRLRSAAQLRADGRDKWQPAEWLSPPLLHTELLHTSFISLIELMKV